MSFLPVPAGAMSTERYRALLNSQQPQNMYQYQRASQQREQIRRSVYASQMYLRQTGRAPSGPDAAVFGHEFDAIQLVDPSALKPIATYTFYSDKSFTDLLDEFTLLMHTHQINTNPRALLAAAISGFNQNPAMQEDGHSMHCTVFVETGGMSIPFEITFTRKECTYRPRYDAARFMLVYEAFI